MTFVLAVLKKFLNESFKDISLFSYQCSLFCCCSATFISYHRTKCLSTTFLFFFFAAVQQLLYLTRSKVLCQQLFKIIFCCPLRNISASRVSLTILSCQPIIVNSFFIFFFRLLPEKKKNNIKKKKRRKRDLNPRAAQTTYTLSRGASSAS